MFRHFHPHFLKSGRKCHLPLFPTPPAPSITSLYSREKPGGLLQQLPTGRVPESIVFSETPARPREKERHLREKGKHGNPGCDPEPAPSAPTLAECSSSLLAGPRGPRTLPLPALPSGQLGPVTHHRFSKRKTRQRNSEFLFRLGHGHGREEAPSARAEVWGPKAQGRSGRRGPHAPIPSCAPAPRNPAAPTRDGKATPGPITAAPSTHSDAPALTRDPSRGRERWRHGGRGGAAP